MGYCYNKVDVVVELTLADMLHHLFLRLLHL
jgi:hypothetical protein